MLKTFPPWDESVWEKIVGGLPLSVSKETMED